MRLVDARGLPSDPIDASAAFAKRVVPEIRYAIRVGDLPLAVGFDPADYTHTGWRLAAIQSLAREAAPGRVNALASDDGVALAATLDYIAAAPGLTGQYLQLDGQGAGSAVD